MTTKTMDKKIEEQLTAQETNLKELCNNLVEKLTSELTSELEIQAERINQLKNDKSLLQRQVLGLKKENIKNQVASEENEQYRRRLCWRIDGIPSEKKESSENVLHKVTEIWMEAGVDIPNEVVDRDHRIGPSYTDKNLSVKYKSVIVRFITFWHKTMAYRLKKKMKPGARVKLDLTKSRYMLLVHANKVVKRNLDIKFCYADINCGLKIKWVDESIGDKFFSSMDELQEILGNQ